MKNVRSNLRFVEQLFCSILLFLLLQTCTARISGNAPYVRSTKIIDFRYSSARIDAITKLSNGTWFIVSNGHYWMLNKNEFPHKYNVRGSISQLYDGITDIQAVWLDPYSDYASQIYLLQNTPNHGLRVVCQEFDKPFTSESSFCHLPVTDKWRSALKDLDKNKPVDAVTWRNRTRGQDGGFWVFFQGHKMITIDPYEMRERRTYDLQTWMQLSEAVTAVHYEYERSIYHLFFENNIYRTWTVNRTYMSKLPMGWDRAFLHGKLSQPMKINRDFFGFSQSEIMDYSQPYLERFIPLDSFTAKQTKSSDTSDRSNFKPKNSRTSTTTTTTSTTTTTTTTISPATSTESDVVSVTSQKSIIFNKNRNRNSNIREHVPSEDENSGNVLEKEESISYEKQLMELDREGVKDFSVDVSVNSLPKLKISFFTLLICIFIIIYLFV